MGERATVLHEAVAEVTRRQPDADALVGDGERLTYRELDDRAARMAATLKKEAGIALGSLVALRSEPDVRACVAILAILKGGAAYLPLDPSDPPRRATAILRAARPALLIDHGRGPLDAAPADVPSRTLAELEACGARARADPVACSPDALAYVPFTSGSTGRPKGVLNSHRACLAHALSLAATSPLEPGGRWCLKASLTFVDSIYELFGGLLEHGTVAVAGGRDRKDPRRLLRVLARHAVTRVLLVPALLDAMLDIARPGEVAALPVRTWLVGGDRFPTQLARRLAESGARGRLLNIYGCSEAPGTAGALDAEPTEPVSIGGPLAGVAIALRDDLLRTVASDERGEVCLGGPGLADGYLGAPAETAAAFRPDPDGPWPGARIYCTGDLGVRRDDDTIGLLGRRDAQVKVRGHRVELREVERALLDHPGVREAVAAKAEGPTDTLVASCRATPDLPAPTERELRAHARARLPPYMRPAVIRVVDELPLSPNGKVDRLRVAAELRPDSDERVAAGEPVGREVPIVRVWRELLRARVGPGDDVVVLGVDSLLAARAVTRLRDSDGLALEIGDIFDAPTPREQAARARPVGTARPGIAPETTKATSAPLSYPQRSFWFLDQLDNGNPAHTIVRAFAVQGGLDVAALRAAAEAVVRRHDALRTAFELADDVPVQVVRAPSPETLWWEGDHLDAFCTAPFDLANGELVRFLLAPLADGGHRFAVALHHACGDDWSSELLFDDLSRLYGTFVAGGSDVEPAPEPPYRAFARWQHALVDGGFVDGDLEHWRARLADLPDEVPFAREGTASTLRIPAREAVRRVPETAAQRLEGAARERGDSVQILLLAAYIAALARRSGKQALCVGIPVSGRTTPEVDDVIGCFVNVIPFRADVSPDDTFESLRARIRATFLADLAHAEAPFEKVAQAAATAQRPGGTGSLYQAMFGYQARPDGVLALEGVDVTPVDVPVTHLQTDLDLAVVREAAGMSIALRGNATLFDEKTLDELVDELRDLAIGTVLA